MFGYRSEEMLGKQSGVLFTPEDIQQGVPQRELETARFTGRAEDERWHVRKDGTRLYCSGVMTPSQRLPGESFWARATNSRAAASAYLS